MKTISVKEAAEALGVSPRAIQYKLQNGDLKGNRTKNQYGVAEWRVWPNKEISEALAKKQPEGSAQTQQIDFAPNGETVDAEEVVYGEDSAAYADSAAEWRKMEIERLELMAEKLVKPLAERIESQAITLREQEKVIEDQKRQLRLLPDLQKQAEEERKEAELKALEVEALRKQIAALEEDRQFADAETERLKAKREAEAQALREQLSALTQRLEQPWWKKVFSSRSGK